MLKYFTILAILLKSWLELQDLVDSMKLIRDGWSNKYSFHNVKKALCNSEENKEKKYAIARF